jgi:hypothetical protein
MNHSMTLQLPEDVVLALRERAKLTGSLPEDLAASWLSATVRRLASDPLLQLAGCIKDLPDEDDQSETDDVTIGAGSGLGG